MKHYVEAKEAYLNGLKLEPNNLAMIKGVAECDAELEKKSEEGIIIYKVKYKLYIDSGTSLPDQLRLRSESLDKYNFFNYILFYSVWNIVLVVYCLMQN